MNFGQERKHLRLVKKIQPRPPSLLFHKLKPLVPLSEVHLVPTAPDRYAHQRLHQERLNIMRASAESLHRHQVNRTLSLSPTTMFLVCRTISQRRLRLCSSSRSFLALGWVSRPALPAQNIVRNPMRARPTRLKLISPRPIAGLL